MFTQYRCTIIRGKSQQEHVIHNPYKKNEEGSIQAIPTNYRVDIFKDSINPIITNEQVYEVIDAT